jgi:hypothetical protein
MVTGPSNFPTDRNRKAVVAAQSWLTEMVEYRERALDVIRRKLTPELQPVKLGDSDAVERLKEKLTKRLKDQERMKAVNEAYRKGTLSELGFTTERIARLEAQIASAHSWEKQPYPAYMLKNNGAEIRRLKKRIDEVAATQADEHKETKVGGIRVVENPELGRIQLYFPSKPDEATREKLKAAGFRWASSEGAWQRHLNSVGRCTAERVLKQIGMEASKL